MKPAPFSASGASFGIHEWRGSGPYTAGDGARCLIVFTARLSSAFRFRGAGVDATRSNYLNFSTRRTV